VKERHRTPVIGTKEVYVFQLADSQKNTWWGSWKIKGEKRIFRSLRTEDIGEATEEAKNTYDLLLKQKKSSGSLKLEAHAPTLGNLVAYFRENSVVMKKNGHRAKQLNLQLDTKIIPYFGTNYTIRQNGDFEDRVLKYPAYRRGFGTKYRKKGYRTSAGNRVSVSKSTLRLELSGFKQVLKHCHKHRILEFMPNVPMEELELGVKITDIQKNRRPAFTTEEIEKMPELLDAYVHHGKRKPGQSEILERRKFVAFTKLLMVSGLRPAEARLLRKRNFRFLERGEHEVLIVDVEKSKTRPHSTPCSYLGDTRVAAKWMRDFLDSDACAAKKMSDLVFTRKDGKTAINDLTLNRHHKLFLKANRLVSDRTNSRKRRSFYSYRHHFATFNLRNGVPLAAIATTMATSPDMLYKYYNQNIAEDLIDLFEK